jgi:hypothetical protein
MPISHALQAASTLEGVFTGEDGDRGANRIPTNKRKNLHALWDQFLGDEFSLGPVRRRIVEIKSDGLIQNMALEAASMERGLTEEPEVIELSEAYLENAGRAAQQRATRSAARLSRVLHELLKHP